MKEHSIIYMPLLNEGTEVFRPVLSRLVKDDIYEIIGLENEANINNLDEDWMFPINSLVRCRYRISNGEKILVAYELYK